MIIKVLYVLLVLCMAALVGAVIAGYFRVRHHLKTPTPSTTGEQESPIGTQTEG